MEDMIERMARAGYECSEWNHKQPWEANPWARAAWLKCAKDMLEASGLSVNRRATIEEVAQYLEEHRLPREPYGHAKAAVALDIESVRELSERAGA